MKSGSVKLGDFGLGRLLDYSKVCDLVDILSYLSGAGQHSGWHPLQLIARDC